MTPIDPQAEARQYRRVFAGTRAQVPEARRFVRDLLPNHQDARLIVSEATTNAVLHTRSGEAGGTFTVVVEVRADGTARLEVEDQGGPAQFGILAQGREGGRGLQIIEALSAAWGIKGDPTGRTIWIDLPPA